MNVLCVLGAWIVMSFTLVLFWAVVLSITRKGGKHGE